MSIKIGDRKFRCPECGRLFDMFNPADAEEWFFGHDCEVSD